MLVNYLDGPETHINPNYVMKVWRTENDLIEDGYNYRLKMFGDNGSVLIDRESYMRIVAWIEAQ